MIDVKYHNIPDAGTKRLTNFQARKFQSMQYETGNGWHACQHIKLNTEYPIARDSVDHLDPQGTALNNTHHQAFVVASELHFQRKPLVYLDLGCAGGGLVRDFFERGHCAIGLEGSDYSLKRQRAEWQTIPHNLFTCDIRQPFQINDLQDETLFQFDIISLWDVFEHIEEPFLPQVLMNIKNHLAKDGIVTGSISTKGSGRSKIPGRPHHATVRVREWWDDLFTVFNFTNCRASIYQHGDFPRGNGIHFTTDFALRPELGFHFTMTHS